MITYLMIYLLIILSNFLKIRFSNDLKKIFYIAISFFLIIYIGLRHEVGGDWYTYLRHYELLEHFSFSKNLLQWDAGYVILEYISKYLGFGIYGINTLCSIFFTVGFIYFIKNFNISLPFALIIAFPYLITVAVMGYTRQGVALGLVMAMYAALYNNKRLKTALLFLLSLSFHKSSLITAILFSFKRKDQNNLLLLLVLITISSGILYLYKQQILFLVENYILNPMESKGALARVTINTIPAILLFIYFRCYDFPIFYSC